MSFDDIAVAAAEEGESQLLRRKYPHHAKFINFPPPADWPKGKRRPRPKQQDADHPTGSACVLLTRMRREFGPLARARRPCREAMRPER